MKNKDWVHPVLAIGITVLSAVIARYIWIHAQIPPAKTHYLIWILTFPLSLSLFSILSFCIVRVHKELRKHLRMDAFSSIAVIPYLMVLISWQYWGNWVFLLAIFYFVWFIFRSFLLLELISQINSADQKIFILLFYMILAGLIVPFTALVDMNFTAIGIMAGGVIVTFLIGYQIREASLRLIESNDRTSLANANMTGFFAIVSMPLLGVMNTLSIDHLIAVLSLTFLIAMGISGRYFRHFVYPVSAMLIVISVLNGPEYFFLTIWVSVVLIYRAVKVKSDVMFLEITGTLVVVIVAILGAILFKKNIFLPGDYIWSLNIQAVVFSGLLDIKNGLIFVAPLIVFACIGYIWSFKRINMEKVINRFAPAVTFFPIVVMSLLVTGRGPDIGKLLPFACLLWPYAGFFQREKHRPFANAWYRFVMMLSLSISALYFASMAAWEDYSPSWESLLSNLESISRMDFGLFFPVFNQLTIGWSWSLIFWIGIACGMLVLLGVEKKFVKEKRFSQWNEVCFLILLIITIAACAAGTHHIRSWSPVPLEKPMTLNAKEKQNFLYLEKEIQAQGLEVISWMAYSVHVKQGQQIATIRVFDTNGISEDYAVRAGIETAERVYSRPDVLRTIKHRQPAVERTNRQKLENEEYQTNYAYRANWFWNKSRRIAKIQVEMSESIFPSNVSFVIDSIKLQHHGDMLNWGYPYPVPLKESVSLSAENPVFEMKLSGIPLSSKVHIVSSMSNAAAIPEGIVVGQIEISGKSGQNIHRFLRAGVDTSEWAYDRPDIVGHVSHSRADLAMSKRVKNELDQIFLSHTYSTTKSFKPAVSPVSLSVKYQIPKKYSSAGELTIFSIIFL